jgi:drug/metabolite transporter (DMT)-like permease
MIPLQFLVECINTRWFSLQQQEKTSWKQHLKDTIDFCRKQLVQSVFELEDRVQGNQRHHTSFMLRTGLLLSILFTIPAYLWYVSVNLISMSTLTVVFNTGCFWAYIFSIFMLGDPVRLEKFVAVGLSVLGVVIMAFSQEDDDNPTNDVNQLDDAPSFSSFLGLGVAVVAALT